MLAPLSRRDCSGDRYHSSSNRSWAYRARNSQKAEYQGVVSGYHKYIMMCHCKCIMMQENKSLMQGKVGTSLLTGS